MQREEIAFVGTSDLSGHFRGKGFPTADLPARLERGVGLAPSNIFLSAFGPIQFTAFGTLGEVFLVPDPATRVVVPFAGFLGHLNPKSPIESRQVGQPMRLEQRVGFDIPVLNLIQRAAAARRMTESGQVGVVIIIKTVGVESNSKRFPRNSQLPGRAQAVQSL